ncbi:pentapeptide repeat-containing protein [Streptomyces sp. NPDC056975]|uniref:pentapeptide repeat-containing protein n=1 Tax=Streptomyces sp. NPDC056975 TaxID=3345985 RepID=UPI00363F4A79
MTPQLSDATPSWPYCGHVSPSAEAHERCLGRRVDPYRRCLKHLGDDHRAAYLAQLRPGSDLDHRCTSITENLLALLLDAVRDPDTRQITLGTVRFDGALLLGDADFGGVHFKGAASFEQTTFRGTARFVATAFDEDARFERAQFRGAQFRDAAFDSNAWFGQAQFTDDVRFDRARFSGHARFGLTTFSGNAAFDGAQFLGSVGFQGAHVLGCAWFDGARFESASRLGPLVCEEAVDLSGVIFAAPVVIEAATRRMWCTQTEWAAKATLRLRYATVDLTDAVLAHPFSIIAQTGPFTDRTGTERTEEGLEESALAGSDTRVRVASLRGVDAAHVVLHNVDLTLCRLSGAVHLDQLRLEGEYLLAPPPVGICRRGLLPVRWTKRRTLAEEQHWRAAQGQDAWAAAPTGVKVVEPTELASVYRQLRKSFEDGKNEPDAADFYYGEMEMRRHDQKRPRAERTLLTLYWAVSGYGMRASRALAWLLGAMATTVLVMTLWGIPKVAARPESTGRLTGKSISMTSGTTDLVNPNGPLSQRMTSQRFERSLRVVINSVVFRSSSQDLTTAGTYIEMLSRLVEPALLALAVLAARGRVKR